MAKCICTLSGEVTGVLRLSQASHESPTIIEGEVKGLSPGKHGIAIHTYGDLSDGPASVGSIFNPFGKNHGKPEDVECMAGDLGNILAAEEEVCNVQISSKNAKLLGPHSVIGRSIVVYAEEDDCGRGGHDLSLVTGNSGPRLAAGVIGLASTSNSSS
mmetsp:Transcript_28244/g.43450  ORF Transcript_28244/g.43450 Transcript_28244/m.43450 type:complete len:158 (-) Transcript_28244:25-498(-)|eukprot:CAMPEP_0118702026 /NCGR_PEP_ID=MMETSP0800-20121206/17621_1 /TAXON_ID=210618 ORGANISM="Striatella unipunctata, Strain CCMP2910" /NCGR_SAMPLE_ID=MMETSP0800 /ASSEMBLY_ACC=CAM_ASM_000638 /LENGTH=157 /DNA_ID=CAMNT_0006603099 /DNA_START=79 /DNA_END=552 /DNA_ORIENTATION=-